MNHFYKRYLWLAKALICAAAFCWLWVAPIASAQNDTPTAAATNMPEGASTDEPASTPREHAPASMDGGQEETEITGSNEDSNQKKDWLGIGLIGGAFLFVAAIVLTFFFRRARKRLPQAPLQEPTAPPQTLPGTIGQPYLLDSNGRYFFINTLPFTIGRDMSNNLIIDESFPQWQSVSREHAQIIQHSQGYVVEDRASKNKLRVQGRPTERNLLRNGWKLHVGGVEFTFFDGSNAPGGAA